MLFLAFLLFVCEEISLESFSGLHLWCLSFLAFLCAEISCGSQSERGFARLQELLVLQLLLLVLQRDGNHRHRSWPCSGAQHWFWCGLCPAKPCSQPCELYNTSRHRNQLINRKTHNQKWFGTSSLCRPHVLYLMVLLCFRRNATETCSNLFIQAIFERNYWLSGSWGKLINQDYCSSDSVYTNKGDFELVIIVIVHCMLGF